MQSSQIKQKAKPVIGLGSYALLLYLVLLSGCGVSSVSDQAAVPATTTVEAAGLPADAPTTTEPDAGAEAAVASPIGTNSAGDKLPVPELTAQMGTITFAPAVTDQREPISPSLLFTAGITQVHAIFSYSGMSTAYTWERVWFLNDKEVSRKAGLWTGPESGVFDYFIDNGGRPLPAGEWVLEIYVEGKLLSLGAFVIEN